MRHDARDTAARADAKKPYTEPRLIEYGSIAKLTQTGGGSRNDGGGMMMMGTCL
jgi:hypothetical protein